jgi:hypothetical protein
MTPRVKPPITLIDIFDDIDGAVLYTVPPSRSIEHHHNPHLFRFGCVSPALVHYVVVWVHPNTHFAYCAGAAPDGSYIRIYISSSDRNDIRTIDVKRDTPEHNSVAQLVEFAQSPTSSEA